MKTIENITIKAREYLAQYTQFQGETAYAKNLLSRLDDLRGTPKEKTLSKFVMKDVVSRAREVMHREEFSRFIEVLGIENSDRTKVVSRVLRRACIRTNIEFVEVLAHVEQLVIDSSPHPSKLVEAEIESLNEMLAKYEQGNKEKE